MAICSDYRSNSILRVPKYIPMECFDAVLPEQLLRRSDVNCLVSNGYGETYKYYLCLFPAIAVHLYGSLELESSESSELQCKKFV